MYPFVHARQVRNTKTCYYAYSHATVSRLDSVAFTSAVIPLPSPRVHIVSRPSHGAASEDAISVQHPTPFHFFFCTPDHVPWRVCLPTSHPTVVTMRGTWQFNVPMGPESRLPFSPASKCRRIILKSKWNFR